jgi:hypothetical protein
MNVPFLVPTSTLTLLMADSFRRSSKISASAGIRYRAQTLCASLFFAPAEAVRRDLQ